MSNSKEIGELIVEALLLKETINGNYQTSRGSKNAEGVFNMLLDIISNYKEEVKPTTLVPSKEEWKNMMHEIQSHCDVSVLIPFVFGPHMIEHFTNVMYPILWSNDYVLCSEPYSHNPNTGEAIYIGFYKKDNRYFGIVTSIDNFKTLI